MRRDAAASVRRVHRETYMLRYVAIPKSINVCVITPATSTHSMYGAGAVERSRVPCNLHGADEDLHTVTHRRRPD